MVNCEDCKVKLGWLEGSSCSHQDCNKRLCGDCLETCEKCDGDYCKTHIKNHPCEEQEEDDEAEEIDEEQKFETLIYNADKSLVIIYTENLENYEDDLKQIAELEKEGYVIDETLTKVYSEQKAKIIIVMRRKQ